MLAEPHGEVDVFENLVDAAARVGECFGDVLEFEDFVGTARGGVEVESDGFALEHGSVYFFHFVEALLHGTGAADEFFVLSCAPPQEATNGKFEPLDVALLDLEHLLLAQEFLAFFELVFGIVADVEGEFAVFELGDFFGDDVEEVAVVGDDDDGTGVVGDEFFEKFFALEVEMVVRFVEEEELGLFDEELGETDEFLLSAGEGGEGKRIIFFAKAETAQGGTDAVVEIESAFFFKFLHEARVAVHDAGEFFLVAVDGGVAHLGFERVHFVLERGEGGRGAEGFVKETALETEMDFLGEVADADAFGDLGESLAGVHFSGKEFEDGGFACAVGSNESDARVVVDFPREVAEDFLGTEIDGGFAETGDGTYNHDEELEIRKPNTGYCGVRYARWEFTRNFKIVTLIVSCVGARVIDRKMQAASAAILKGLTLERKMWHAILCVDLRRRCVVHFLGSIGLGRHLDIGCRF